jgi:hypothetical protein
MDKMIRGANDVQAGEMIDGGLSDAIEG